MVKEIVFMKPINQETISWLIEHCGQEKEINILLNSSGGDASAAISFYNFIAYQGISLMVTVIGCCDSAALMILCAAKKRRAYRNTTLLLHHLRRCYSIERNFRVNDLKDEAADLRVFESRLENIISITTGKSVKELKKHIDREKSLTAAQAYKLGLLTVRPL